VIININTMTEGTDIDGVRCVILTRVSKKNTLFYTQRAGRGMRPDWVDGVPVHKDAYIIAPIHHDLLASIPNNVIDINAAWLDVATRNLASYLSPDDEAWINERLDDLQDDFQISDESFNKLPDLASVRERMRPKQKQRKVKPQQKVWYYDPSYDRTMQRRQQRAAKTRTQTQSKRPTILSRIKSVIGLVLF
jgi:superfamily II DNA or RNA helicase